MNAFATYFKAGFFQTEWAESMGWTLLHSLWQIVLVAAAYAQLPQPDSGRIIPRVNPSHAALAVGDGRVACRGLAPLAPPALGRLHVRRCSVTASRRFRKRCNVWANV